MDKRYNIRYKNELLHENLTIEQCSEILQDFADRFVSLENSKTPDGQPTIKGDFDVMGFSEWMERNDEFDDLDDFDPPEPIAG